MRMETQSKSKNCFREIHNPIQEYRILFGKRGGERQEREREKREPESEQVSKGKRSREVCAVFPHTFSFCREEQSAHKSPSFPSLPEEEFLDSMLLLHTLPSLSYFKEGSSFPVLWTQLII